LSAVEKIDCIRIGKNTRNQLTEIIAKESKLELHIEDELSTQFLYSTGSEELLVFGHLLSSGRISKATDVTTIGFDNGICRVNLVEGCTSTSTHTSTQGTISYNKLLEIRNILVENQENHRATRGFHGAILYDLPTNRWFVSEDIGRHNAVDKVIGYGLLEGYALTESLLLVSGRLFSDMVSKGILASIPIVASMTIATAEGITKARESNLSLVGCLSEEGCWLYNEGIMKII